MGCFSLPHAPSPGTGHSGRTHESVSVWVVLDTTPGPLGPFHIDMKCKPRWLALDILLYKKTLNLAMQTLDPDPILILILIQPQIPSLKPF